MTARVLLLCSLGLGGCAHFGGHQVDLQRGYETAHQRAALAEQALVAMEERLERLEKLVAEGAGASGTSLADANAEVARLRGRIEQLEFEMQEMGQLFEQIQITFEERQLNDEARLRQLEGLLGVQPPEAVRLRPGEQGATGTPVPADVEAPVKVDTPVTPEERLQAANEHLAAGRVAAGRAMANGVLQSEAGMPAKAHAQYLVGESWMADEEYVKAVEAYRAVIDQHGSSPWAPEAMLRIGDAFGMLGRKNDAKVFYESVITRYPKSEAAGTARRRLGR